MSIKIMSAVFENETLGPTERLIMLALADHADDAGVCYPSIARLCRRTGLKERSVQTNIRKLVDAGYIRIEERAGRNGANVYHVTATPAADAPRTKCTPQEMHPYPRIKCTSTPAADAPKPSYNHHKNRQARETLLSVLSEETADAFIAHRKALKKPITEHAAALIAKKLADCPNPDAVAEESIMQGWQGVFPERQRADAGRQTTKSADYFNKRRAEMDGRNRRKEATQ